MSNVKVKATKKPVKPVIVVVYILLVILAVVYLAPLLWMLSVSLKDNAVLRRYGRFRHRQNALEIIRIYAHLLPHRNDGSSTLCSDSSFCKICKAWPYQFTGRTNDSLHHFFPANDHFPAYRIFPFHARRNVRGCCH